MKFLLLFIVCLVCHLFRIIYEILGDQGKLESFKKAAFIFMAFNMTLLWVSWFAMSDASQPKLPGYIYMQYTGLIIVILGVILCILTVSKLKTVDGYKGNLIQTGVFFFI